MQLRVFEYYLIIINIVAYILCLINTSLNNYNINVKVDTILTIISLIGGSAGVVIAILIFDRRAKKSNSMLKIVVSGIFSIQIIMLIIIKWHIADNFALRFWSLFDKFRWLLIYLAIINLVTFIAFSIDKISAIKHKNRVKVATLMGLSFIGGSLGALIGMYTLNHKTKKYYFTIGVPLMLIMQIVGIYFLMNIK